MDPLLAFDQLDAGSKAAFEELWSAFQSGSYPVGAALADDSGSVLARGRNRIHAEPGIGMSGTLLGHAEIDALRTLAIDERHDDLTLYTTLEPCLYCMGAVVLSRVGSVSFAGVDPYGGASHLPTNLNAQTSRYQLAIAGPMPGPFGRLGAALPLAHLVLTDIWTRVIEFVRDNDPSLARTGEALANLPVIQNPTPVEFPEALEELWPILSIGY